MGLANFADWGAIIEIFIAIPLPRWNPPRRAILGKIELGQFFADGDVFQVWLVWKMIAEADAIIINAEGNRKLPRCASPILKCDSQFVVAVQDRLRLTPRLVPSLFKRALGVADGRKRAVITGLPARLI
jgi:hypothetical protein